MDSKINKPEGIEFGTDDEVKNAVIQHLKSRGVFDRMRRECLSDLDTKPAFLNLNQRIEGYVSRFVSQQRWTTTTNKIQLRDRLRRNLTDSGMMKYGIDHLVESAVSSKSRSVFYDQIQEVVTDFLGVNQPKEDEMNQEEGAVEEQRNGDDQTMDTTNSDGQSKSEASKLGQGSNDNLIDREEVDMEVDDSNSGDQESKETFIQTFTEIETPQISPGYAPSGSVLSENSSDARPAPTIASAFPPPLTKKPFVMQLNLNPSQSSKEKPPPTTFAAATCETRPMVSNVESNEKSSSGSRDEFFRSSSQDEKPSDQPPPTVSIKTEKLEKPEIHVPSPSETVKSHQPKFVKMEVVEKLKSDSRSPVDSLSSQKNKLASATASKSFPQKERKVSLTAMPVAGSSSSNVKSEPAGDHKKNLPTLTKKPQEKEQIKPDFSQATVEKKVEIPGTEYLSDVSSVHTSDLSDFDDRISVSSVEEDGKKQQKPALKRKGNKTVKSDRSKDSVKGSREGRRERKLNPKYASEEYSSVFNSGRARKNSDAAKDAHFLDSLSSDDDMNLVISTPVTVKSEPKDKSDNDEEDALVIAEPVAPQQEKSLKKKRNRGRSDAQSQRYDSSDLWKPRPSVGSSRRNRNSNLSEQNP